MNIEGNFFLRSSKNHCPEFPKVRKTIRTAAYLEELVLMPPIPSRNEHLRRSSRKTLIRVCPRNSSHHNQKQDHKRSDNSQSHNIITQKLQDPLRNHKHEQASHNNDTRNKFINTI
jgi:hypothetical protein